MPSEPTPPIRELPAEIEEVIQAIENDIVDDVWNSVHFDQLRHAIRAALDEEWDKGFRQAVTDHVELVENIKALRERCERLRRVADVASLCGTTPDIVLERLADLHEDDYADDLRPRRGDER